MKKLFYTLFLCALIGLTTTSCVEKTYYTYETTEEDEDESGSESGENATENENDNNNESDIDPDNDTGLDYSYCTAYFAQQQPSRTSIADREGNVVSVGAVISGKTEVDINDWTKFIIKEDLLTDTELYPNGTGLVLMPEEYYYLSNESIMTVTNSASPITSVDIYFTDDFYADPLAVNSYYAIPFELTETSCDEILENYEYSIVAVKYQSKYHGTYYVQGYTAQRDGGSYTDITSYNALDLTQNITSTTTTTGRNSVSRVGLTLSIGGNQIENGNINITVPDDGEVTYDDDGIGWVDVEVTAAAGDTTFATGTGIGKMCYDEETHDCIFKVSYLATDEGIYYEVSETLTRRQDPLNDLLFEIWTAPGEV